MPHFLTKFAAVVRGVLNGLGRLLWCGIRRNRAACGGRQRYPWAQRIPYKDIAAHSLEGTAGREEASLRQARHLAAFSPAG